MLPHGGSNLSGVLLSGCRGYRHHFRGHVCGGGRRLRGLHRPTQLRCYDRGWVRILDNPASASARRRPSCVARRATPSTRPGRFSRRKTISGKTGPGFALMPLSPPEGHRSIAATCKPYSCTASVIFTSSPWPGLTRPATPSVRPVADKDVDPRVAPAGGVLVAARPRTDIDLVGLAHEDEGRAGHDRGAGANKGDVRVFNLARAGAARCL